MVARALRSQRWFRRACRLPARVLRRVDRGLYPGRSPDVTTVASKFSSFGGLVATSHSGPWGYLQRIPIVLYGPGFIRPRGELVVGQRPTLADLAPTVAELLGTEWPEDRPGRPLREALVPERRRPGEPRLVVTLVWDGGGWNVLDAWPHSWPYLATLMERGTSVAGGTVGSSPSVTPSAHATIGTGAWPRVHGIVDIPLRDGERVVDSFPGLTPRYLELSTLADRFDRAADNRPKVAMLAEDGWHLGMMGHGAYDDGGDKDIALMIDRSTAEMLTNEEWYRLPSFLPETEGLSADVRAVDASDGRLDGLWMGNDVLEDPSSVYFTPAWTLYQQRLVERLLRVEGFGGDDVPDLLYVNSKQIDHVGHQHNMLSPEMDETLRITDGVLHDLVRALNDTVGKRKWVLLVTADHGQTPLPESTGGWPIDIDALTPTLEEHFGVPADELVLDERPVGMWLDYATLQEKGITTEDVASYLTDLRARDNLERSELPALYHDRMHERLFAAAFPTERMADVLACSREAERGQ
ncbi:MAG TPA: alkaline phosphatase family protein [Actinomycetota bacterium]|nr:alkaline phosphatase family protein [Actinomycetota bacterium]